jgi:Tfp pilus assembly protein PilF
MDQETRKTYTNALELCEKGRIKAAIEKLKLVIKAYPDYPDVHNALGLAYSLRGNNDDAVTSFKMAIVVLRRQSKLLRRQLSWRPKKRGFLHS